MIGLGTLINTGCIIVGGILGMFIGKFLKASMQDTLIKTCGVATLFIGIAGALEGILSAVVNDDQSVTISAGRSMFLVLSLVLGAVIGELINLDHWFEVFGEWLKKKTKSDNDNNFVNGFVTASLTVCIGAMAIIGAIKDGTSGDYSILAVKGVLDFVIILSMACSLGKGTIFSAIPVFVLQGLMTLLAKLISPVFTEAALSNLSMIGSILIFCVGMNLIWGKKIKVANLLPALIFAVAFSYLPWSF